MYPVIDFNGFHIGTYGLLVLIGALAAFAVALYCARKRTGKWNNDFVNAYLFALAFGAAGSVLLKPVINILTVVLRRDEYKSLPLNTVTQFVFGEVVFYGGLIGGAVGLVLYCRMFKTPLWPVLDIGSVSIPLGHAIGRVGCLFGGCCWGVRTTVDNPFSVVYPPYPFDVPLGFVAPSGTPLWNIPIMESIFLSLLFVVNFYILRKCRREGLCTCIYLLSYGIWRFAIEYLRGDAIRGKYLIFTTSQYISIAVVIIGVIMAVYISKRKTAA